MLPIDSKEIVQTGNIWCHFENQALRKVPRDVWRYIFSKLEDWEMANLDLTCRSFHILLKDDSSWNPGWIWNVVKNGVFDKIECKKDRYRPIIFPPRPECKLPFIFKSKIKLGERILLLGEESELSMIQPITGQQPGLADQNFEIEWRFTDLKNKYGNYDRISGAKLRDDFLAVEFVIDLGWVHWDGYNSEDGYDDERRELVVINMKTNKVVYERGAPRDWLLSNKYLFTSDYTISSYYGSNERRLNCFRIGSNKKAFKNIPELMGTIKKIKLNPDTKSIVFHADAKSILDVEVWKLSIPATKESDSTN